MSLAEIGVGLLQTHVTWSDIELDMQDALGTVATFGPNKKVTNIGEGNGFMSRIGLIEPDWQNGTADLPKKFVVKIISQLSMLDMVDKFEGMEMDMELINHMQNKSRVAHNVEVHTYELIEKYGRGKIPYTKIYKAHKFDDQNTLKGYMLMEFMEDLAAVHVIDEVKPEELDEVLRAVAAFERITFEMTDSERNLYPKNVLSEFFGQIFTEKVTVMMLAQLEKFVRPEMHEKMEKLKRISSNLLKVESFQKLDELSSVLGMTQVLCHTDMWSTNMLWSRKDGGLQLRAVIDYQTAHIGCAAADLGRLFCSLLGGKARQQNWKPLMDTFYRYVKEEMGDNMPYTLEQLEESYRRFLPFACFLVVPSIPSTFAYINQYRAGEERDASVEFIHEKVNCLIDDLLESYERNLSL